MGLEDCAVTNVEIKKDVIKLFLSLYQLYLREAMLINQTPRDYSARTLPE